MDLVGREGLCGGWGWLHSGLGDGERGEWSRENENVPKSCNAAFADVGERQEMSLPPCSRNLKSRRHATCVVMFVAGYSNST